jgi:hypothetical protein
LCRKREIAPATARRGPPAGHFTTAVDDRRSARLRDHEAEPRLPHARVKALALPHASTSTATSSSIKVRSRACRSVCVAGCSSTPRKNTRELARARDRAAFSSLRRDDVRANDGPRRRFAAHGPRRPAMVAGAAHAHTRERGHDTQTLSQARWIPCSAEPTAADAPRPVSPPLLTRVRSRSSPARRVVQQNRRKRNSPRFSRSKQSRLCRRLPDSAR